MTVANLMGTIRRLATLAPGEPTADEQLLDRFFAVRDEDAFDQLVRRHGPMVMGVCLRVLEHRQDAEDAFQATFLMLVRKGRSIRRRSSLASWLHRVAFRVSLTLKARVQRIRAAEPIGDVAVDVDASASSGWLELRQLLDQELERLPLKYRAPILLCCLQGKSYEEAAEQIGCPRGTVAVRLLRARAMLKKRLLRRGLTAAVGCLSTGAVLPAANAVVPAAVTVATVTAAIAVVSGAALASVVSASIVTLVSATSRDMWFEKCKSLAIVLLAALGLTGTSASLAAQARLGPPPACPSYGGGQADPGPGLVTQPGDVVWRDESGSIRWVTRPATTARQP